jgi:hypothetical protein
MIKKTKKKNHKNTKMIKKDSESKWLYCIDIEESLTLQKEIWHFVYKKHTFSLTKCAKHTINNTMIFVQYIQTS